MSGFRLPTVRCPHCRTPVRTRDSRELTPLFRQLFYHCDEPAGCGHAFQAELRITHTIWPSTRPAADIRLPQLTHFAVNDNAGVRAQA